MKKSITVSPEVIRALSSSNKTADEILREVLNIKAEGLATPEGVIFTEGSLFLAWHKDRPYWGRVENSALIIDGQTFQTLASATRHITHRGGGGWDFWMVKLPDSPDFVKIETFIKKH